MKHLHTISRTKQTPKSADILGTRALVGLLSELVLLLSGISQLIKGAVVPDGNGDGEGDGHDDEH